MALTYDEKKDYDNAVSYKVWVKNFALNLNDIWNGSSARKFSNSKYSSNSAIVIGRGPSLSKHNHLDILRDSNIKDL